MTTKRRLVASFPFNGGEIRIHRQSEWEKYRVSVWQTGRGYHAASDYFTEGRDDAWSTAESMHAQCERNTRRESVHPSLGVVA